MTIQQQQTINEWASRNNVSQSELTELIHNYHTTGNDLSAKHLEFNNLLWKQGITANYLLY